MKIAIAGDSAGDPLVRILEEHLRGSGFHQIDNLSSAGFYADLAASVANLVKNGKYDLAKEIALNCNYPSQPIGKIIHYLADRNPIQAKNFMEVLP